MRRSLCTIAVTSLITACASVTMTARVAPPAVTDVATTSHSLPRSEYLPKQDPLSVLNPYITVSPAGFSSRDVPVDVTARVPADRLAAWTSYVAKADGRVRSGMLSMETNGSAAYRAVRRNTGPTIHWYGVTLPAAYSTSSRTRAARGGPGALDNTRCLTPRNCYTGDMVRDQTDAVSHCQKVSTSAAGVAAVGVAVTTTPIDWPGIATVAAFTWLTADAFCSIGWW